jgi:hypothetical protein
VFDGGDALGFSWSSFAGTSFRRGVAWWRDAGWGFAQCRFARGGIAWGFAGWGFTGWGFARSFARSDSERGANDDRPVVGRFDPRFRARSTHWHCLSGRK